MYVKLNLKGTWISSKQRSAAPRQLTWLVFPLLSLLCGCTQHTEYSGELSALRRGLSGEPASLDPAAATDSFSTQVIQDLYEGLTSESPTGDVVPGVATSWTVDQSGTKYTFQLRTDARWSNGKPVRAQDFVTSWRRVVDPKQKSPLSNDLRLIAGAAAIISGQQPSTSLAVFAPSDDVLIVNLEQPAPYFPQILAHSVAFPIYSETSARAHDAHDWVSNGAYTLSGWRPGTSLDLTANAAYWDKLNVKIKQVVYQIVPDQNSQFAAYRAGQIDMTDTVPVNTISSLRKDHPKELAIAPYLATAYYGLNLAAQPFQGNPKLREALAMAIDRPRLVNALALGQIGAYGFVPPGTWNYTSQHWEWEKLSDSERIAEARRLYQAAGYSSDAPLHLRLLFNSNPAIKQTAIIIAAMWKEELGIDTELIDEEFRVYLQSRHEKNKWEVVRLAWNADYNDASNFLDIFRSNSANNDTGYANPLFDKLLDDAAKNANPEERRALLENAERVMLADYPVLPLYFLVSKRLVKPYLVGVRPNPLDRVASKALVMLPH
jgi:oligopeptide transport system substrate-binding protein